MSERPSPAQDGAIQGGMESVTNWYDWAETTPSSGVIETISAAMNRNPTDVRPLYPAVDPDALDTLLGSSGRSPDQGALRVTFTHDALWVTVTQEGEVTVAPLGGGR